MNTLKDKMPIDDDIEHQVILNFLTNGTIMVTTTVDNFIDQLELIHIAYISMLKAANEDRPAVLS